jgi:hypothetical protein
MEAQHSAIDKIDEYLKEYKNRIPIPGFLFT